MTKDNLIEFKTPEPCETFNDALSELVRQGARQIIAQAVEAELSEFLAQYQEVKDASGRQGVVRNGYLPERTITTGLGEVEVRVPKVRDRTAATISRLKAKWHQEHQIWQQRSIAHQRYVYIWADGIYFNIRADERQCMLVVIGVSERGYKELLAIDAGYRESELSWKPMLLKLKDQGLEHDPQLAIGDGALGFWKALPQVFPTTKKQRCWVHKTANVLNKLPKSLQSKAKQDLWESYRAETKPEANQAFNRFINTDQVKYPEACECLAKDRDVLLTFYDFPAEHWVHIRSTNPIESTFATVRLRTDKTPGAVSKQTILALVFKLVQSAQKRWLRIRGFKHLAEVIDGVPFKDGIRVEETSDLETAQKAA
jgi:transposase-like protein